MALMKLGVKEAKRGRLCYCGLVIVHFEQTLVEQQMSKNLTIL